MGYEQLSYHLGRGEDLVYLSGQITTPKVYFAEEERLARFLVATYPQFRRFRAVGIARGWIRDEEFTQHIRYDLDNGFTPYMGAVHRIRREEEEMYLKTILPKDQVGRMTREQKIQSAWGPDASHRSWTDVLSTIIAVLSNDIS